MQRKPIEVKKLESTYRPDRDRKTLKFKDTKAEIKPPAYLRKNKIALAEWKAVAPSLVAEGILKAPYVSLLASYCVLYARWREAAADVEKNGQFILITSQTRTGKTQRPASNPAVRNELLYQAQMLRAAVKFGLNPLDSRRIEVNEPQPSAAGELDDWQDEMERVLSSEQ